MQSIAAKCIMSLVQAGLSRCAHQHRKHQLACRAEAQKQDFRTKDKKDVRVLVAGSTGYIGKYVTKELIKRGYNVVPFAREKSGVGGKQSKQKTEQVGVACMLHIHGNIAASQTC